MKARFLVLGLFFAAAASARAGSSSYAQCGTYDSYILIYKTTEKFEELGKLRCGEKVEVLNRAGDYSQIRTLDDRSGWVRDADLADAPPPAKRDFTFGFTEKTKEVSASPTPARSLSSLKNDDILAMHAEHPGSDLILKKIKFSRCAFDTSPDALRLLKASGLADIVILAMLEAPVASEASERTAPESVRVTIPDGTPIEVQLNGNVSSEDVQEGTIVEMSAAEDLVVNGVLVVVRGSAARARIMAVRQPGSLGGSGQVVWFMQDIDATSGDRLPVTFAPKQPGNKRLGNFEGYPFFVSEYHKGDRAIKLADKRFRVVIHGDTFLSVSQSLTAVLPAQKPETQFVIQSSTQSTVRPKIESSEPFAPDEVKPQE